MHEQIKNWLAELIWVVKYSDTNTVVKLLCHKSWIENVTKV